MTRYLPEKKNAWGTSGGPWFGEGNTELPPTPAALQRGARTCYVSANSELVNLGTTTVGFSILSPWMEEGGTGDEASHRAWLGWKQLHLHREVLSHKAPPHVWDTGHKPHHFC